MFFCALEAACLSFAGGTCVFVRVGLAYYTIRNVRYFSVNGSIKLTLLFLIIINILN